jgi:hypothetical protein
MVQEYDCRFKTLRHVSRLHVSYSPEIKENAFHRHCIRQQIISETINTTACRICDSSKLPHLIHFSIRLEHEPGGYVHATYVGLPIKCTEYVYKTM